jgi:hypothetical protein
MLSSYLPPLFLARDAGRFVEGAGVDGRDTSEHDWLAIGKFRDQRQFAAHGLDGTAERGDVHVCAFFDLGNLLLSVAARFSILRRRLAGKLLMMSLTFRAMTYFLSFLTRSRWESNRSSASRTTAQKECRPFNSPLMPPTPGTEPPLAVYLPRSRRSHSRASVSGRSPAAIAGRFRDKWV